MNIGRLRALLRQAAFVGLPTATLSLSGCGPCPPEDHVFLLRSPAADVRALIDACTAGGQDDCGELCARLVKERLGFTRAHFDHCELHPMKDGYFQVHAGWQTVCPGGRRPQGFRVLAGKSFARQPDRESAAGALLAQQAQLEGASVFAFRRLRDELRLHGAPRALCRAALVAARDEIRHARCMTALARRHGVEPPEPHVSAPASRPLVDMLIENAVEGCVHETYGAALAHHQAAAAADPVIRRAMKAIAEDETRHASLAWQVFGWGQILLSARDQRRVSAARRRAARDLRKALAHEVPARARMIMGLPDPERASRMAATLKRELWS